MNLLKSYLKTYSGFTRSHWLIAVSIIFNSLGSMLGLFISIYLHHNGISIQAIGWVFFGFGAGSLVGGYLAGWLCDVMNPRKMCIATMVFGAIFIWAMVYSVDPVYIGCCFTLVGICNAGYRTASILLITQGAEQSQVSRLSGFRRTFLNLGVGVGSLIGGLLATVHFDLIFYVDGALTMVGAVLLLFVKEMKCPAEINTEAKPITEIKKSIWPAFIAVCAVYFLVLMAFLQWQVTLSVYMISVVGISLHQMSWLFAINCFIVMFLEVPLLTLLANVSQQRVAAFGAILQGIAFAILVISTHHFISVFCYVTLTFGEMLFYSPLTAILLSLSQRNKGKLMGVYQSVYASAALIAPVFGSYIYAYSHNVLWLILGALTVIAALIILQVKQGVAA